MSNFTVPNTEERPFVTTGEIVKIANVHPNTVAMWRATKKIIPRDKIGSSFLYGKKEVMDFLKNRKIRKPRIKVTKKV